ncbi:family 1 glycosylhydrolase [Phenylobacterium soli]|uniref:dTDP-4-dehydrorhamnose reductase n=1 Tax=Phenylobacterium soli TaxID=2170551 RepID=A0A328AN70_9CAUL|nr:family 1 glycosylhydrolase [Phenylobacterium soli]RAK55811.1 dTDP-4-dehydrorhamnose reductase [Phenylobacterium soli]
MRQLELWGGHEQTVNRVGGVFHDQTVRSGHHQRLGDLERFAALGLKALRYPVLWERVAPRRPDEHDWRWTDERLARIRALGMRPIAGLLHHGSGPRYTSLVDEGFPAAFAAYARAAAERYPWIGDWTPINEPLTTARFSALYGHWYPHLSDEPLFWAALLNQIEATALAMREIRAVRPDARLIQTEDLGRTYSTRPVAIQADHDNTRRWMTWDLLAGRVTHGHPLWSRLASFGLGERLRRIADAPCPADVIGVNHYLTSDRFLDHATEAYPPERIGGNDFMAFADVEAVRVALPAPGGLEGALDEAWSRYGRPVAVTESHNGCTREEQVRWIREAWRTAQRLRERGVEVEAVTAWALLGTYDWNSLLTRHNGHYEVGAFDVRSGAPRPTALAGELKRLAEGEAAPPHPATQGPGWWRRDIRLEFRPVFRTVETPEPKRAWHTDEAPSRPLLITGATGTLGKALARACEWRGIDYRLTSRAELPLDDEAAIARALDRTGAWGVINAAGFVRVDAAEADPAACHAANAEGAIRLARACAERDLPFAGFSSDLVFDGRKGEPYLESDPVAPLNAYGESKARAEREILALERALMIRTAAFFSPYDPYNFAAQVIRALAVDLPFDAASDLVVSPTYVPDLVDATLDLVIDGETGIRHLANPAAVSWAEFARRIAAAVGLDPEMIREVPSRTFRWPARRPSFAALDTERGQTLPPLDQAIARYVAMIAETDFAAEAEAQVEGAPQTRAVRDDAPVS